MDENAGRRLRRMRASLDTGEQESAELPFEKVSLNFVEQGRHRRQNEASTDQHRAQPQDNR
jgi:hypothetical protein